MTLKWCKYLEWNEMRLTWSMLPARVKQKIVEQEGDRIPQDMRYDYLHSLIEEGEP